MTIMMLAGGTCQVRYPCGHTAICAASQTIGPCPCDPQSLWAVK